MPVEEQLLPSPKLKPIYDDIVWLHVYNDFKEGDADRAATRIRIRFSVSSWPQLLLVDPYTLEVVGETGRQVDGFLKAVADVKIQKPKYAKADELMKKLKEAEELAAELETKPNAKLVKKALESDDVVVRYRAAEYLSKEDPDELAKRAPELLKTPNDLLRYAVCQAIAKAGEKVTFTEDLVTALEDIARDPKDSRNPNVMRINAVQALARCGDAGSLEVIKPFAQGAANNGLTGISVDAIGEIGARSKEAKAPAAQILLECFPESTGGNKDAKSIEWYSKMAGRIAEKAHKHLQDLTGKKPEFPKTYNEETRAELKKAFEEEVAKLVKKAEKKKQR
ncbi:MAG: HEAT repeat domain-containing protein [Planctomycetes bacterium]|nr:HEAT repeat domain-containing protein [Planctomycetota bacterium]